MTARRVVEALDVVVTCAMWSDGRPKMYSEARVYERGKLIREAAFRDVIATCRLGL